MVRIEDRERLAELVLMFHYEQRDREGHHSKLIGVEDAALLKRTPDVRVGDEVPGDCGRTICETFHFRGCQFRYVYDRIESALHQAPAGSC